MKFLTTIGMRFAWLYRAKPTSLNLVSQLVIVLVCMALGYLMSFLAADSMQLGSYLAQSFIWLFGIILFSDLGGHFNDTQKHMTFWMNFISNRIAYLIYLWVVFFAVAFVFSMMSVLLVFIVNLQLGFEMAKMSAIPQAILHQALGLTIVAVFSHALGAWFHSGMRQMICLSTTVIIFFLSSIIPYFFSFNDPAINFVFELIPRIDLYDNRDALYVALVPFPWKYTATIAIYAQCQYLLCGVVTWFKLRQEKWH